MSQSWDGRQGQPEQRSDQLGGNQPGWADPQGQQARPNQQPGPNQQNPQPWQSQQRWPDQQGQPHQQAWSHQQNWPAPPATAGRRSTGRRGMVLAGAAGGVVLTVLVAAVLLLTGAMSFGSGNATAAVDARAVILPAQLAGFNDKDAVADARSTKDSEHRRAITSRLYARTSQQYSTAYHGAGVGVRTFADADLMLLPTVIAVRAPAGGLTVGPDPDPADLGMGAPRQQVVMDGNVQCLIVNIEMVTKGKQIEPDKQITSICRLSDATMTVDVVGNGPGVKGRQQMIELTKAAFAAVTGSSG